MRGSFVTLCLLAAVALGTLHAQEATWRSVSTSGLGSTFFEEITFPTSDIGYAVGWTGSGSKKGVIVTTTDGGSSWTSQAADAMQFRAVSFSDAAIGYVVGYNYDCKCGVVMETVNGGKNWQGYAQQGTGALNTVSFGDANHGVIAGDAGVMFRTTDGGANWQAADAGTTDNIEQVFLVDASIGYAVVTKPSVGRATLLYKTTDGGATWRKIQDFSGTRVLIGIDFIDPMNGSITGIGQQPAIMRTTDGGETWNETFSTPGTIPSDALYGINFADANNGLAVGDNGVAVRTTDGGATWKLEQSSTTTTLKSVAMADAANGVAVGYFGTMVKREGGTQLPTAIFDVPGGKLDFGVVSVGATQRRSFTIKAANGAGLNIASVELASSAGGFNVVTPPAHLFPLSIGVGETTTVTVEFAPTAAGSAKDTIIVLSNDASTPTRRIPLEAVGTSTSSTDEGLAGQIEGSIVIYPNPVDTKGSVRCHPTERGRLSVAIFDPLGNRVVSLFEGIAEPGDRTFTFDTEGLANGTYYCVMETSTGRIVRMMTIAR